MKKHDVAGIREEFAALSRRANESLGSFDESTIGIGRYVAGASLWEIHNNGDELLLVTDAEVRIEVLEESGHSWTERLDKGSLLVVAKGKWHQLTATDNVNILYISPGEEGTERKREHPYGPEARHAV